MNTINPQVCSYITSILREHKLRLPPNPLYVDTVLTCYPVATPAWSGHFQTLEMTTVEHLQDAAILVYDVYRVEDSNNLYDLHECLLIPNKPDTYKLITRESYSIYCHLKNYTQEVINNG